jgi:hypothetical protein
VYPQTLVKIVDNSDYNARVINSSDRVPIAMVGFASDRGSEDLTDLVGEDWFDMYGHTLHFAKYGQPLIQAGKMIEAGARLYSKRVVAPDAKLANQGVYAHLLINRQVVEDSPAVPAVPSTGPGDPGTPAIPAVTHVETDVTIKYNSLCVSTTSIQIGKLVQYRTDTPRKPGSMYEKTGVTYFLDCFYEDDVKSIFVKRENYELVGKVGFDYELSSNGQYLYRKQKCM